MKPIDIRNENWADLKDRVCADRLNIYAALSMAPAPITTRQLAEAMGMDLLTVRPRVTELCELFLVECVGRDGRDGLYVAVPWTRAENNFERAKAAAMDEQMVLL